jgi:hypothetical protein
MYGDFEDIIDYVCKIDSMCNDCFKKMKEENKIVEENKKNENKKIN